MEYIFIGIDSLVVSSLYYFYRKKCNVLSNIKNAVELNIDEKGQLPNEIKYGMIVGKVKPDNLDLVSNYNKDYRGVIRVHEIREHGTRLANNITSDTTRLISKVVNDVPFNLIQEHKNDKPIKIHVDNPLEADYLFENFALSYTKFEPSQDSLMSKFFSAVISKETTKGIETTEQILTTDTQLTGFGRLEKINTNLIASKWLPKTFQAQYRLSEPTLKGHSFILTSLSRPALIERLKSVTRILKISLIIFGSLGALVSVYCIYKNVSSYIERKKREYNLNQARIQRLKNQRNRNRNDNQTADENQNEQSTCVICLVNPRELVLLDCGHVCLCMDCLERMPNTNCPICRVKYRTFAPVYIP